jgi:splicing suppressor protein 51
LLPAWWTAKSRAACLEESETRGEWSDLTRKVGKAEVVGHYGDAFIPMQLRMFGEQVTGRGPGGQSGAEMIENQMEVEKGLCKSLLISHVPLDLPA